MIDVLIIGGGVAGMTAGIYAGRGNKSVMILEENNIGGTVATLDEIKNFPGYLSIDGFTLTQNMQMQCMECGVQFEFGSISKIDFDNSKVYLSDNSTIEYRTLIIASGMTKKKLNINGEDEFKNRGVSYCAICDGNLYKNKKIIVFTENNSAENSIKYLLNLSNDIVVLDISNGYKNEKLKVYNNVFPIEIKGDNIINSVVVNIDGVIQEFLCDGLFIDLGKCTDVQLYKEYIDTSDGLILSDENMHTNIPNVFVAGDIRKKSLKQIITACSDGAIAGTEAIKYISNMDKK